MFATLPPSAMRMELTRLVSSRLALPESLAEQLLGQGGQLRERRWRAGSRGRETARAASRGRGGSGQRRGRARG